MATAPQPASRRGRPRAFDPDAALERAMLLFWERGYLGASYAELTHTMGVSASSFQNTFGTKEEVFRAALERYVNGPTGWYVAALEAPTDTRTAFAALIAEAAATFTGEGEQPRGCLASLAGIQLPPALSSVREFAVAVRRASNEALAERVRKGIREGDVPPDTDPERLASFFSTVFRGMAVQAADGASRAELNAIGEVALTCWPTARHP